MYPQNSQPMKKIASTLILSFIVFSISYAQIGFRGGINLSNQSYSTNTTTSSFSTSGKIGYLLGVNYEIDISEAFSIRPGVEYALKGAEISLNGAQSNSNFDYLEIPVDFAYNSSIFSAYAGPYFAFLTSAKNGSIDLKPNLSTLDIGLNIGLEINVSVIGIGVKYGLGLSNIDRSIVGDESIKNNVLSLYISFRL